MSDHDSFIDEVTEEVRRDKLFAVFRKYGWIGILAVLLIVGGASWKEWQKSRHRIGAEAFGDALTAALANDDAAARVAALDTVAAEDSGDVSARKAVLGFIAAEEAVKAGDTAGALSRLQAISADPALDDLYRQLARLKTVALAGDKMDAAERDATLADLAQPGAPFRVLALEQQAIVLMQAGKTDEALTAARAILQEPDLSAGLRRRVTQLIVALGGDPEAA